MSVINLHWVLIKDGYLIQPCKILKCSATEYEVHIFMIEQIYHNDISEILIMV